MICLSQLSHAQDTNQKTTIENGITQQDDYFPQKNNKYVIGHSVIHNSDVSKKLIITKVFAVPGIFDKDTLSKMVLKLFRSNTR